jgi:hypothetical protein
VKRLRVLCLAAAATLAGAASCSTSARKTEPPPAPRPALSRTNPNVIEETATYIIERYPKKEYIRVDDRHFRHPLIGPAAEYFKEDDEYFYVKTEKVVPEEEELKRQVEGRLPREPRAGEPETPAKEAAPAPPPSDFEDLVPARTPARFRLEEVDKSGLPDEGFWRASFAVADMNGDGIPDIVAPPPRLAGDTALRIWLGDGKGHFTPWKLTFIEKGKENLDFSLDYGGVAVGDIDGDGQLDVVAASHNRGLVALFGNGKGTFVVSREGFRGASFSTQAVALADLNGDGKLDVIADADRNDATGVPWNRNQAEVYLYAGHRAFQWKADGILDASFSNFAAALDFDRDGKTDVLLGSHLFASVLTLFRNQGDGTLSPVVVPDLEVWAYHFSLPPGTFGRQRAPAFADLFFKASKEARTAGINVHAFRNGQWEKRRVWREKSPKALLRTIAFGDLDGDGLDDIVFPDTSLGRLRIFLQQPDGSFKEADEKDEPKIGQTAQCVRLADLDGDGRLDVVLSKTVEGGDPSQGGWTVFLNRK